MDLPSAAKFETGEPNQQYHAAVSTAIRGAGDLVDGVRSEIANSVSKTQQIVNTNTQRISNGIRSALVERTNAAGTVADTVAQSLYDQILGKISTTGQYANVVQGHLTQPPIGNTGVGISTGSQNCWSLLNVPVLVNGQYLWQWYIPATGQVWYGPLDVNLRPNLSYDPNAIGPYSPGQQICGQPAQPPIPPVIPPPVTPPIVPPVIPPVLPPPIIPPPVIPPPVSPPQLCPPPVINIPPCPELAKCCRSFILHSDGSWDAELDPDLIPDLEKLIGPVQSSTVSEWVTAEVTDFQTDYQSDTDTSSDNPYQGIS